MGILDNKTRIMDTIITQEGRRQLATGKMRIEFVSFSDAETFYQGDAASGSTDASARIYLEACELPQDQITFEADDSGKLMPYRGSSLGVRDGKVLSGSSDAYLSVVTGSAFASLAGSLLASSIDNFQKLRAIGTDDMVFDDDTEFTTNTNVINFSITDSSPFRKRDVSQARVEHIESLFQDKRLSHLPNFRYMPPVNVSGAPLGNYPVIGQRQTSMTYEQLKASLVGKEERSIEFSSTSIRSNIVSQMFELKQDSLTKLDVIDYGVVTTDDASFPEKHVFFVGKVFIDSLGAQTFVNLFVLIYE